MQLLSDLVKRECHVLQGNIKFCMGNVMFWHAKVMLCYARVMLCYANAVLCFGNARFLARKGCVLLRNCLLLSYVLIGHTCLLPHYDRFRLLSYLLIVILAYFHTCLLSYLLAITGVVCAWAGAFGPKPPAGLLRCPHVLADSGRARQHNRAPSLRCWCLRA